VKSELIAVMFFSTLHRHALQLGGFFLFVSFLSEGRLANSITMCIKKKKQSLKVPALLTLALNQTESRSKNQFKCKKSD